MISLYRRPPVELAILVRIGHTQGEHIGNIEGDFVSLVSYQLTLFRYRPLLKEFTLVITTINLKSAEIRRLAHEAFNCGLLSAVFAVGIRVKGPGRWHCRLEANGA